MTRLRFESDNTVALLCRDRRQRANAHAPRGCATPGAVVRDAESAAQNAIANAAESVHAANSSFRSSRSAVVKSRPSPARHAAASNTSDSTATASARCSALSGCSRGANSTTPASRGRRLLARVDRLLTRSPSIGSPQTAPFAGGRRALQCNALSRGLSEHHGRPPIGAVDKERRLRAPK